MINSVLLSVAVLWQPAQGLCFLLFYVREHLKSRPATVMILKHLRRRGQDLKSHLTDWESWESKSGLLLTLSIHFDFNSIWPVLQRIGYQIMQVSL